MKRHLLKPAVFVLCMLPLGKVVLDAALGALTANPISEVLNRLGFWTLVLLIASLVPTPMKILFGATWPLRVRRMVGLFAFFYGVMHFAVYLGVDQFFNLSAVMEDVQKRPFITAGFTALLLLVPLAITSTNAWVKRLGYTRWKRLHRLVYAAAILGVVHHVWRVKADVLVPTLLGTLLAVLLLVRVVDALRAWRAREQPPPIGSQTPRQTAA